jgi:hypothetical protein
VKATLTRIQGAYRGRGGRREGEGSKISDTKDTWKHHRETQDLLMLLLFKIGVF